MKKPVQELAILVFETLKSTGLSPRHAVFSSGNSTITAVLKEVD